MKLILKNWPPFRDCELTLPRFTVIVGQNGVGKSRLLSWLVTDAMAGAGKDAKGLCISPSDVKGLSGRYATTMMGMADGMRFRSDWGNTRFLMDDVSACLHPKSQTTMVALLREALLDNPQIEIAAVSHSPYFVDSVALNEVLVVASDGKQSSCKFLSEHPDAERWRNEMSAGEFWSSVGEEWVLKPRPRRL